MKLRLLLAIAAMLAVQLLLQQTWQAWAGSPDPLVPPGQLALDSAISSGLISLFAAGLGGYIAGRRFLLPALAIWALLWLVTGYILWRIANGQATVPDLLQSNGPGLLATLLATILGSLIGGALHRPPSTGRAASAI